MRDKLIMGKTCCMAPCKRNYRSEVKRRAEGEEVHVYWFPNKLIATHFTSVITLYHLTNYPPQGDNSKEHIERLRVVGNFPYYTGELYIQNERN